MHTHTNISLSMNAGLHRCSPRGTLNRQCRRGQKHTTGESVSDACDSGGITSHIIGGGQRQWRGQTGNKYSGADKLQGKVDREDEQQNERNGPDKRHGEANGEGAQGNECNGPDERQR